MRHKHHHAGGLVIQTVKHFNISDFHEALLSKALRPAAAAEPDGLGHYFAEMAVEPVLDFFQLRFAFAGKTVGQVIFHHAHPVAEHFFRQERQAPGQRVMHPQRKRGQRPGQTL